MRPPLSRVAASLLLAGVLATSMATETLSRGLIGMPMSAESQQLRLATADNAQLAAFYQKRDFQPLWIKAGAVRPEARQLVELIASAPQDGLDPERYGLSHLKAALAQAEGGDRIALARFEALASLAYAAYAIELHTPLHGERVVFTDAKASPPPQSLADALTRLANAPTVAEGLEQTRQMHPLYEALRSQLKGASGDQARLIRVNMDRARALPADPGPRYIVVDAASARLWMYEDGKAVDSMKVVVGQPSEPTPLMAGAIRYVVFNPYWNVPEDIVRRSIAPQVISGGPGVLAQKNLEALSSWKDDARVLSPAEVDWKAVASGRKYLRVRQKPGADNMMGGMKFMLPNKMGIYLHDTPNKALFGQDARWSSAGCVRVEDARRLARWLYGSVPAVAGLDQRVDLVNPVPVYITYFTAMPTGQGLETHHDIYGRDSVKMAGALRPAA